MLSFLLVPALLAVAVDGSLLIYPEGSSMVHDLTTAKDSAVLVFSCMAPNMSPQEAQLKWFDPNNNEISSTGGSTTFIEVRPQSLALVIANPKDDDGGVYTCKGVVNDTAVEVTKMLKIYKGIKILSDKQQYIVNATDDKVWCKITSSGEFTPSINWYKITKKENNKEIWDPINNDDKYYMHKPTTVTSDDQPYLEIRNVTLSDQFTYMCNINVLILGKFLTHKIKVIVTVPPTFSGEGLTAQTRNPVEGSRLELSCRAEGVPTPLYNFIKYAHHPGEDAEVVMENSTNGQYVIDGVNRTQEGVYSCVAFNQGGRSNVSVEVNVRVPPVIEDPQNVTLEEGQNVQLDCMAVGDPAPELSWRHQDSSNIYSSDSMKKIFVEDTTDEDELDEETRVFRRQLSLIISDVKPEHTGHYVCKTHNSVGEDEHTFHVEVDFKPVFGDKVDSHFYGWVGSNTHLMCKVKGNPLPVITWYKDGIQLKKDYLYDIYEGDADAPYQAISYLQPQVDQSNQDTVFGDYTCEAKNYLGKNQVELTYNLAVVPEPAEVEVVKEFPTSFKLQLERPMKEGGQQVTHFIITYIIAHREGLDDPQSMEVDLESGEDIVDTELTNLTPNTEYIINITAVNNVGPGQPTNLSAITADYSKPGKVEITSDRQGDQDESFTLTWKTPMTGGADIENYILEYFVVEKVNRTVDPWRAVSVSSNLVTVSVEGWKTSFTLDKLTKDTYYQVKLKAVNRIGSSEVSVFIIKTSKGALGSATDTGSRVQISAAALLVVGMATACWHPGF